MNLNESPNPERSATVSKWETVQKKRRGLWLKRSVITTHLRNVFAEGELVEVSNVQNLHITRSDSRASLAGGRIRPLR